MSRYLLYKRASAAKWYSSTPGETVLETDDVFQIIEKLEASPELIDICSVIDYKSTVIKQYLLSESFVCKVYTAPMFIQEFAAVWSPKWRKAA